MMDADKEQVIGRQLRDLARLYCDGAFNKGEYRRRRRELLSQCIEESPPDTKPAADDGGDTSAKTKLPYGVFALVALTVSGILIWFYRG